MGKSSKIKVIEAPGLGAPERREGERSEPDRSAGASNPGGAPRAIPVASIPDPEVAAKPVRRRFTGDYKRSIVEQADACQDTGAVGALLRREGLYSSHLSTWRRQARQGELAALAPKKRGRKTTVSPLVEENRKLLAANVRLTKRLENAELIIDVQKKLAVLLGRPIPDTKSDEENE
jgi:transposase-like protein